MKNGNRASCFFSKDGRKGMGNEMGKKYEEKDGIKLVKGCEGGWGEKWKKRMG
jgi:hypothetical protein